MFLNETKMKYKTESVVVVLLLFGQKICVVVVLQIMNE